MKVGDARKLPLGHHIFNDQYLKKKNGLVNIDMSPGETLRHVLQYITVAF